MKDRMATLLRFSILYYLLVFGAGFVLGVVRVSWLLERMGERNAELAEMPVMAVICALVARRLVQRNRGRLEAGTALLAGGGALVLLLATEFTLVLTLRGQSLAESIASRDPVSGTAYALGLIWFAVAPWVVLEVSRSRPSASAR